ncbi:MAG: alpha/beta hydrolase [Rickettsia endosymbiont of Argas persicus]
MQNNDKYQEYFDLYNNYAKAHNLGNKYLEFGEVVVETKYYRVLYYSNVIPRLDRGILKRNLWHKTPWSSHGVTNTHDKTFLIIPSIFNSPEIFFLSRDRSFMDNLRGQGEVYLIDWFEVQDSNYLLDNYVHKVIEVINSLNVSDINLIGHCIGGNLAIAANVIKLESIKTLTLLTCPWDFSHFSYIRMMHKYLKLDDYVEDLPLIPKIHIQTLFFLLFPNYFKTKLNKFFSLNEKDQELAFRIENWLMSGHSIPNGTYHQIMQNILDENMFAKFGWKINDVIIDPSLIDCPVNIITAEDDKIVPKSSILPLQKLLKNSNIIEASGGHISYLINNKLIDLFKEYKH